MNINIGTPEKRIIDQQSSYGLLRTNTKLSGNIKIVVDSKGDFFLETIDANSELASERFKNFKLKTDGYLPNDIFDFFKDSSITNELLFETLQNDNLYTRTKREFSQQYDTQLGFGASYLKSKKYDEEFSIFAPLWLGKILPDFFVVMLTSGPVSKSLLEDIPSGSLVPGNTYIIIGEDKRIDWNGTTLTVGNTFTPEEGQVNYISYGTGKVCNYNDSWTSEYLNDMSNFNDTFVSKTRIIKTFDLRETSPLGKYLRKYINSQTFPDAPLNFSFKPGTLSTWTGIDYRRGVLTGKGEYMEDVIKRDSNIIDWEKYITGGWEKNGLLCANLINFEWAFDDVESSEYEINRYSGFYCNETELATFYHDGAALHGSNISNVERLITGLTGYKNTEEVSPVSNPEGVVIFPEVDTVTGWLPNNNILDSNRFFYLKDNINNLHSISEVSVDANGKDYIRLKSKKADFKHFTGFKTEPQFFDAATEISTPGKAYIKVDVLQKPINGDRFLITWNGDTQERAILCNDMDINLYPAGSHAEHMYPTWGTLEQVIDGIVGALNEEKNRQWEAVRYETSFYIIAKRGGNVGNGFKLWIPPTMSNTFFIDNRWAQNNINKDDVEIRYNTLSEPIVTQLDADITNIDTILDIAGIVDFQSAGWIKIGDEILKYDTIGDPLTVTLRGGIGTIPDSHLSGETVQSISVTNRNYNCYNFIGGGNAIGNRFKINRDFFEKINTNLWAKSTTGKWGKVTGIYEWIDNILYNGNVPSQILETEDYFVVELDSLNGYLKYQLSKNRKLSLFEGDPIYAGVLSFLPVKDFDFNFHKTDTQVDSNIEIERYFETSKDGIIFGYDYVGIGITGEGISYYGNTNLTDEPVVISPNTFYTTGSDKRTYAIGAEGTVDIPMIKWEIFDGTTSNPIFLSEYANSIGVPYNSEDIWGTYPNYNVSCIFVEDFSTSLYSNGMLLKGIDSLGVVTQYKTSQSVQFYLALTTPSTLQEIINYSGVKRPQDLKPGTRYVCVYIEAGLRIKFLNRIVSETIQDQILNVNPYSGTAIGKFRQAAALVVPSDINVWEAETGNPRLMLKAHYDDAELNQFTGLTGIFDNSTPGSTDSYTRLKTNSSINEYDVLKENYQKDHALLSRVVPTINKWVYASGFDVKGNGYRLNNSNTFGRNNFSPSFDNTDQNTGDFTHEWYYFDSFPFGVSDSTIANNKHYFNISLDVDALKDVTVENDYFTDYFTYGGSGTDFTPNLDINFSVPQQERYSVFQLNKSNGNIETFFKGIKILINEKSKDLNGNEFFIKNSTRYSDYKFSTIVKCVRPEWDKPKPKVSYEFIENRTFKTITLVLTCVVNDYRTMPLINEFGYRNAMERVPLYGDAYSPADTDAFDPMPTSSNFDNGMPYVSYWGRTGEGDNRSLDLATLYTLKSERFIAKDINGFDSLAYGTSQLSWPVSFKTLTTVSDYGINFKNPEYYIMENEIAGKETGEFPEIHIFNDKIKKRYILNKLNSSSRNSVRGIWNNYDLVDYSPKYNVPYPTGFYDNVPTQYRLSGFSSSVENTFRHLLIDGGFNTLKGLSQGLNFSTIANLINTNNPAISYTTYESINGNVVETKNAFQLILQKPDKVNKNTKLDLVKDLDFPNELKLYSEIGWETSESNVQPYELLRYSGNYMPKMNTVLFWKENDQFESMLVKNGNNLQATGDVLKLQKFNTVFDVEVPEFGTIYDFYYNKVSDSKILDVESNTKYFPKYQWINEVAISRKPFNIFSSTWNPEYYNLYNSQTSNITISGTREMSESRSFYGSKLMNTPDDINLQISNGVSVFDVNNVNLETDKQNIVFYKNGSTHFEWRQICDRAISRYLLDSGIQNVFDEHFIAQWGERDLVSVRDNAISYITKNIIPLYYTKKIHLWVWKGPKNLGYPEVDFSIDDNTKLQRGYVRVPGWEKINPNSNTFDIIGRYKKDSGLNYSFAFTFIFEKI